MGWPAGGDRKHVLERIEARLAEISHADNALVGRTHETVKRLLGVLQHSVGNSNADSVPAAAKAAQVLQPDRQLSLDDYYASRPHRPNRCIGARQSCVLLSDLEPICASLFSELLSDEVQPPLLSLRLAAALLLVCRSYGHRRLTVGTGLTCERWLSHAPMAIGICSACRRSG
jgi:hypothetical protein